MNCYKHLVLLSYFMHLYISVTYGVPSERPNVIFILADDLGWDDVSFHGSKQIPTPNIDSLAYDGIILSNYYVQPICTPTRGALLTGRHPIHTGLQHWVIDGSQPYGLPLNETILPQYLKTLGYKTHMIGKWHLGFHAIEYTPTRRGFDSHYGYFQAMGDYWDHTMQDYGHHKYADQLDKVWHLGFHAIEYTPTRRGFDSHYGYFQAMGDYWDHTMQDYGHHKYADQLDKVDGRWGLDFRRNDDIVKTDYGKYSTHLFAEEAQNIIQEHDMESPLFMYLPFQAVHSGNPWKPLEAPYSYYEKMAHIQDDKRRMFAAMVSALDDAVGNITKALHTKGMLNNSIIVFSTDNGGPAAGYNMNFACNAPLSVTHLCKNIMWTLGKKGRGTKAGLWEGGIRGTGLIWSPLLQQSGYTSHIMMQVIDWLPTLLSATGYNMSLLPENIDGIDHWSALSLNYTGKEQLTRTEILHNIDPIEGTWAVRVRDMKLIYAVGDVTREWDDWYLPEGIGSRNINKNKATPIPEEAPNMMFDSSLKSTLENLGRPVRNTTTPYMVNCGPKPGNTSTNCKVWEKPCLYNITADPCEYTNLAALLPSAVQQLLERVNMYNRTAVTPGNKPEDLQGFPIHHGGIWVPWIKLQDDKETTELLP